jgi:hypothetical protein
MIAKLVKVMKALGTEEDEITVKVKEAYKALGIKAPPRDVKVIRNILQLYREGRVVKAIEFALKSSGKMDESAAWALLQLAKSTDDLDERALLVISAGFVMSKRYAILLPRRDWFEDLSALARGIGGGFVVFTYDPRRERGKRFTFATINVCSTVKTIAEVANTI